MIGMRITAQKSFCFLIIIYLAIVLTAFAEKPKRFLTIDDFAKFQDVGDLQCSSDGKWIAYTVSESDLATDKRRSSIWMVNWNGGENVRLTYGGDENSPRWSPDGKHLAFLSTRPANGKTQVWLLDRRGGEARQLTNVKEEIDDYRWSPDGKKLVLVMRETADSEKPKPIVIDRFKFKQDIQGYLTAASRTHLYLFDIETQKLEPLTANKNFEDSSPVWSPDGSRIAYVSSHAKDADQTNTNDIFLIDARPGRKPVKLLTADAPNDQQLLWSPDGRLIAYLVGADTKFYAYSQDKLAIIPATGGTPRLLTEKFDRMVSEPQFSADSSSLTFMVSDDRVQYPAKIAVSGGSVQRLLTGNHAALEQCRGNNHIAITLSTDTSTPEIYALEGSSTRKLTSHNDRLLSQLQLGAVEDINFRSKDGTEIHGLVVKPSSFKRGKKYPTIVWIHGGPNMQDDHSLQANLYPLQLERQLLAANGYVVLAINYRGSSGRGTEFSRSIFADWGHKEVADLLAGVDEVIRMGIADPDHLGIGGWSYGGILTDATIATDPRFKAAISGAGSGNHFGTYGTDQYAMQYNTELGPPWSKPEVWMKLSHAFFHADRIKTPTLFVCGEKDFNVPVGGSEQMYQALRTLGVPTQLVIYPDQYHILTRPSFIRDRLERYLAWFAQYLK
jgi:dipeptidyl aminopeptidase/acylaminoacyl peptidase